MSLVTPRERQLFEELRRRLRCCNGHVELLLSRCEDGDRRKIDDEAAVRHGLLDELRGLCEWLHLGSE